MLTTPIVEGAYYEREDGAIVGPFKRSTYTFYGEWFDGRRLYRSDGTHYERRPGDHLTRRVWPVYSDPAEVVAELREMQSNANKNLCGPGGSQVDAGEEYGFRQAADLVAEKLGVSK